MFKARITAIMDAPAPDPLKTRRRRGMDSITDVLSFPMISTREEFNPEYDVDLGF